MVRKIDKLIANIPALTELDAEIIYTLQDGAVKVKPARVSFEKDELCRKRIRAYLYTETVEGQDLFTWITAPCMHDSGDSINVLSPLFQENDMDYEGTRINDAIVSITFNPVFFN